MSSLNCSNCSASLPINSDEKYLVCEFCGSTNVNPYAEKNLTEEQISEGVKKGDAHITLNDYVSAMEVFKSLSRNYPYDFRGHWGVVRVLTKNLTYFDIAPSDYSEASSYYEKAHISATEKQREIIDNLWKDYSDKYTSLCNEKHAKAAAEKAKSDAEKAKAAAEKAKADAERLLEEQKKAAAIKRKNIINKTLGIVVFGIIAIANLVNLISLITTSVEIIDYSDEYPTIILMLLWLGASSVSAIIFSLIFRSRICAAIPSIMAFIYGAYFWIFETRYTYVTSCGSNNYHDACMFPIATAITLIAVVVLFYICMGITALLFKIIEKMEEGQKRKLSK